MFFAYTDLTLFIYDYTDVSVTMNIIDTSFSYTID